MASIYSSLARYIPTVIGSFFPTLYGRERPTPTSFYWEGGNLTETYGLLPELVTFAVLWDAYAGKEDKPFSARTMFLIGVCAGVELFLRANMVMAWIPIAVIVIGDELRKKRNRNAGMIILYGLLGVLSASLIPLFYCLKHGCMSEMFFASFLFNMRYVGDRPSLTVFFSNTMRLCFFVFAAGLGAASTVSVWRGNLSRVGKLLFLFSFLFSVGSVLLSGRISVHYNLYLVPFAIPVLLHLTSFASRRLSGRVVLLLLSFLTMISVVMNSSFARDTVKKLIHYSGTNYALQEMVASKLETDYPGIQNILVADGSPWFYARLNMVPEERFFYLPTIDYDAFPDAADAQADAILNGVAEAVIVEWSYPEGKIWLPNGARNEEVTMGLTEHYTELFSAEDTSLYIRNDVS